MLVCQVEEATPVCAWQQAGPVARVTLPVIKSGSAEHRGYGFAHYTSLVCHCVWWTTQVQGIIRKTNAVNSRLR
jgi:hypothetical protein